MQDLQASLPLKMLRSWDFLDHGDERITPILRHPEQGPVNSSLRDDSLRHAELVSASSPCDFLGNAFNASRNNTKVARSRNKFGMTSRKVAFTLAEVLITLGIIGVVAALTLPTLIANYQKQVYVNQLKKSVSVLSNGFKLMMGHEGVTALNETEAFGYGGYLSFSDVNAESPIASANNHIIAIKEGLASAFSGIQFASCDAAQVKYLNGDNAARAYNKGTAGSNSTCIKFPDGSEIYRYNFISSTQPTSYYAELYIDVNGPKNPNTIGRDIFVLYLLNNGTVVGKGSQIVSELVYGNPNVAYWRTTQETSDKCTTDDSSARGIMCAGRVLEEDAMNY